MADPIPLIILAGGIDKPPVLPEGVADRRPLSGAKGMDIRLAGRPLIDHLLERLLESGEFGPIWIAGPVTAYGPSRMGCEVIDTNESLGRNLHRSLAHVRERLGPTIVGITTSDILPEVEELRSVVANYRDHAPSDFWFPLIRVPEDPEVLGASSWKPQYELVEASTGRQQKVLPGHLLVLDPTVLYERLAFACFEVAYRSRNRRVLYRLAVMVRQVLFLLAGEDLRSLLRFRFPRRMVEALGNGILLGFGIRSEKITEEWIAERLRRIYIQRKHRRAHPERRARMPMLEGFSLAKDIDTREEAEEIARTLD